MDLYNSLYSQTPFLHSLLTTSKVGSGALAKLEVLRLSDGVDMEVGVSQNDPTMFNRMAQISL